MSMMAVSYTELLQNSLEFRRAWRVTTFEDEPTVAALTSTDILLLGLLLQLLGVRSAQVGQTRLSDALMGSIGADVDPPSPRRLVLGSVRPRFDTLRVLPCDAVARWQTGPNVDTRIEPQGSPDPGCFVVIHAHGELPIVAAAPDADIEITLRPLGSLAPALWASHLFVLVTSENRAAVDGVLNELRGTLGDPGLDPLVLYEQLQRQRIVDPDEVGRLREEVSGLRARLADVQDHSRRFATGGLPTLAAVQPSSLNGADTASKPTRDYSVSAGPELPDHETVTRQLRYAHNQIAFLTTYLSTKVPLKTSDQDLLARSPLFDAGWYAERYRVRPRAALDHFLANGRSGQFDPSPIFNSASYYAANPDVQAENLNPLVHYLRHGAQEGRPLTSLGESTDNPLGS